MGFNPFSKHDWDKKARDVLNSCAKPIKSELYKIRDSAKGSVNWVKDQAKKELYKVKDDCKRWVKDAGTAVKKEIEKDLKEAGDGIKHGFDEVKGEIEDKANDVKNLAEDAKEELEKLPEMAEEEVKKALEKISEEISAEGIKKSLDTAADVIELLSPDKFTLILGIELALVVQGEVTIQVGFPNPLSKLTEIRNWAKNPPKGRSKIIECVKDFAPDSIGVEAKVSGNGMSAEWSGDSKYDKLDKFLEKHGV